MGKLAEIKTKQTSSSADSFLDSILDEQKRKDSNITLKLLEKATGEEPKMWGSSMIGFGNKRYKSPATGREVDWFRLGFSPRKANLSLHLMDLQRHTEALKGLGKYKTGSGCLYINKLTDVDIKVLEGIITEGAKQNQLFYTYCSAGIKTELGQSIFIGSLPASFLAMLSSRLLPMHKPHPLRGSLVPSDQQDAQKA